MGPRWEIRLQLGLVVLLFLGSLATLLFNTLALFGLPQREAQAREQVGDAGRRLTEAARPVFAEYTAGGKLQARPELHRQLADLTEKVLADVPGAEGGFYLAGDHDEFTGYAFPTRPEPAGPPPPEKKGKGKGKGKEKHKPKPPPERDPPPEERPYIRAQVRECLNQAPGAEPPVQGYDVKSSRVVVAADPVGQTRPAPAATWVMIRLTGREQQQAALQRYQVSTALAYGAILLAIVLTANLGRNLRRERAQRERMREELRRSEHLAALGKLLAGVAHEVRNPLAGIRSTVQLWQRLPDTARSQGSIHAVVRAVDRLNEIISRLLYFAQVDNAERQTVSVNSVLKETLSLLEAEAASQSVAIACDLDPSSPSVLGSAGALGQVFLNLATNALQAMPKGGWLRCSTRRERGSRTVEVRFSDSGPGISAEGREHLFEPFFTTRPDGTGLGLALCREIVLQHGGQIELEAGGPGTTFRVVLPATG